MSNSRFTVPTRQDISIAPLHVVILAGGLAYREKSKGPKILQTHNGLTILELQTKVIRHLYPRANISVTAGFQADRIIRSKPEGVAVIENQLWETLNTVEEIRLYLNSVCASRVLFIDGSIYFSPNVISPTMCSSVFYYKNDDIKEIGIRVDNGMATHLSYGLEDKWSGTLYLEGKSLEVFQKICSRENGKLCLFEAINLLLEKNIELKGYTSPKSEIIKL